jgi:hypothetical protein
MSNINTYNLDNYSVIVVLRKNNIYLQLTDDLNFEKYEGNIDGKDIHLEFELEAIYKLICKTFNGDDDSFVNFKLENNNMILTFNIYLSHSFRLYREVIIIKKTTSSNYERVDFTIDQISRQVKNLCSLL